MMKLVVVGTTALFLTASSIANAQSSQTSSPATPERLNATDRNTLTDMRVDLVKAALIQIKGILPQIFFGSSKS